MFKSFSIIVFLLLCIVSIARDHYSKLIILVPDKKHPAEQLKKVICYHDAEFDSKQDKNNTFAKKKGTKTVGKTKSKNPVANTDSSNQTKLSAKNDPIPNSIAPLTDADRYKICITKGDNFYKKQRYKEAKAQYAQALKIKPDDMTLRSKLKECEAKCAE